MKKFIKSIRSPEKKPLSTPRRPIEDDYDDESVVESQNNEDDDEPDDISELNDESAYGSDTYSGSYDNEQRVEGTDIVTTPLGSSVASSVSRHSSQTSKGTSSCEEKKSSIEKDLHRKSNGQRELFTIDEKSERSGNERDDGSEESSEEGSQEGSDVEDEEESGSESDSSGDTVSEEEDGNEETSLDSTMIRKNSVMAQPMDVLNAIACALWDPEAGDDDSVSDDSVASDSDEGEDVLDAQGEADLSTFSRQERERALNVFHHCAIMVISATHICDDMFITNLLS